MKDLKNGRRNWENSTNMTKAVEKHATVCLKLLFLYRLYYCYKSVSNFYGEQSFLYGRLSIFLPLGREIVYDLPILNLESQQW